MGNWTRVMVEGTCPEKDVSALERALDPGHSYENFHPLVCGGISGLPNWASTNFLVVGNLAERDYTPKSVAQTLEGLAKTIPEFEAKVHMGGDYEADECVATVTLKDKKATIGPPEREAIPQQSAGQVHGNFLMALMKAQRSGQ